MRKRKGKKIIQFDENFNYVNCFDSTRQASRKTNVDQGSISRCCIFWSKNCDKESWKRKDRPQFKAGGYIWRFYSDFENRD